MNNPTKIRIIGSVGSGKTTLAKKLSAKWKIPYYELDNVVWRRESTGDIRRTEEERNQFLAGITNSNAWIIEGVHNEEWTNDTFEKADLIIFLDTPYYIRTYRIIKRFIKQKLRIEKSHYEPTWQIFFKMFKWNRYFEEVGKRNVLKILDSYNTHSVIYKGIRMKKLEYALY
ncbi:DNA topology modulation protein FlaR [Caldibacillus lycopersici]|uniref:DNA topology modulation protein FlaR n=1 Tax=Perspicuibacillus lycopersici TaxID=1325689 RepID=A0AAE3IWM3_9BACI|nr:DNA topology modulation protein FlaR [Perspicuibacillus lycopersici]MCU9614749.1 DNA topology modulation protein FlaR [Perspicuibacillus lycopersici]